MTLAHKEELRVSKDLATACRAREDLCGHRHHRGTESQSVKLVGAGKGSLVPCQGQEGFSEEVN